MVRPSKDGVMGATYSSFVLLIAVLCLLATGCTSKDSVRNQIRWWEDLETINVIPDYPGATGEVIRICMGFTGEEMGVIQRYREVGAEYYISYYNGTVNTKTQNNREAVLKAKEPQLIAARDSVRKLVSGNEDVFDDILMAIAKSNYLQSVLRMSIRQDGQSREDKRRAIIGKVNEMYEGVMGDVTLSGEVALMFNDVSDPIERDMRRKRIALITKIWFEGLSEVSPEDKLLKPIIDEIIALTKEINNPKQK